MGMEMSRVAVGIDTEPTFSRGSDGASSMSDMLGFSNKKMGHAYWEAEKGYLLSGVVISDEHRSVIESRPPDKIWDSFPEKDGDPYVVQDIKHSLFTSWTEWVKVQPMKYYRHFLWKPEMVGFKVAMDAGPDRDLATFPAV
jgi:hypothetical protein